MGKHSGLLHVEYLRQERARQKRAFLKQFVLGASPLVLGALVNAGLPQTAQAQAVNLNPSVNNIIADGRTRTKITTSGTHSRITTDTVSNGVGFNSFSDFQQAAGTRVDLMVPDAAGNLVNMVSNGAVVINGELNAFKDGSIGGNIFFSSPDGFIVGQNGRVNVGSLAVNTPTQAFLDRVIRSDGSINDAVANQLMRGEIPVSPNGHIAIMGEINAKGSITLQGQTVSVTGDSGPVTGEDFGHRTMFNSTVNAQGMVEGGALVSSGGRISIVAAGGSRINGRVDASAPTAASKGGEVSITGGDIAVGSDATVSADGDAGGEIVVFADGTLVAQDGATFSAAGIGAGDGGFIELSGRDAHIGSVNIDLSSVSGRAGTFLVDPFNLYVGGVSNQSGASDDASISTNILSNGASIRLEADNSITIVSGGILDSRMLDGGGVTSGNSGDITLQAPQITLEDGSKVLAGVTTGSTFTGGDVLFEATRTNGGTAQITIGGGGASGPELTGRNITLTASSTVNQASLGLALPTATARITANSGTIDASGTFTATATATGAGGLALLPLGVVVTNVTSEVDIKGSTDLTAAAVDVDATSSVSSMILTQSLAPANSSADGAVAVSTINSTAIARVGGAATLDVAGATDLNASNTVTSTSDATPQAAAFGASVGVSVINAITTAEIADAAAVSTGTLGMDATTSTETTVKAVAGAGGATEPSPGSQATTYLTDAKYGGQATTSDGGVSVAGALAISDLTSTTNARINSSAATTVTGALSVSTSSGNKADVIADGTAVTSDTGVGVALGINIAKVVNDAVISSAVNAGSAALSAARPTDGNAFTTSATSGAGAANVGLAGSFALNLIDTQSIARLAGSSVVTIAGSGAVSLSSDNATESSAKALPSSTGATGDTVGVGAGIAMNIVANRSYADVADDAVVTDAGDLTLSAAATHVAETEAEAGSSGGISLTPALALSLITNTTTARLGTGGTQEVTGAVSVSAAQHSTITTEASGKAAGSKAAIGASLALALVDDRVLATTARNVDADGAVSFSAAGASLSTLEAEASAVGAAPAEDDGTASDGGDVDTTTTQSLESGSSKQKAAGVGDADQQTSTDTAVADEDGRSASTSEGKVSVAAAVGINVQTSSVKAEIPDNIAISAGGVLKLAAINNTDGKIEAVGDAVGKPDASGETPPASQVGIGAAVAVNVVKVRNDATLGDAAHSTGGVSLSATKLDVAAFMANPASTATRGDVFLAKASSGAGASKVGVAGSVALNLIDTQSVARISGGATVTLTGGGNVSLTTDNQTEATAEALPVGGGASGATVGVGASVALNILANRSVAEVADGAVVTDAGDLTLSAAATHVAETKAEAGSSGGISVTPALALSLITNTTTARLGTGGTQEVTGAVSVSAAQHSTITTEASGKAAGSKAAIGASLALALVDDRVLATTARNVDADGAVSFSAAGASLSTLEAEASAVGAAPAEDDGTASDGGDVDTTTTQSLESGSSKQKAAGVGDSEQQGATDTAVNDEDSKDSRSAETSEGKVSVAAAVGINVQTSSVKAEIPDNITISAGGVLKLAAINNTDGKIEAVGDAVGKPDAAGETPPPSQVGIGAAVAVNVVKVRNDATLGDAAHNTGGVSLSATKLDVADFMDPTMTTTATRTDDFLAKASSGAGGSKVGFAGSVALNLIDTQSVARISGGATVTLTGGGNVSLTTDNRTDTTAEALPVGVGVVGATVGVGASVALNILANRSVAEIADGAVLTGADDLTLAASATHAAETTAEAGSSGGISVTPALALSLITNTTTARLGTLAAGTQDVTGAVSVSATQQSTTTTEASGKAAGTKAAIGASLALAIIDDRALATTARNIDADGAVSFNASGVSSSTLEAVASAAGAKDAEDEDAAPTSDGDSVDKTATTEFKAGAGKQQAAGVGDSTQQTSTSTTADDESSRSAKTSEGKVAVAAAVAINVQKQTVEAVVPDGVDITAGGSITVASGATTGGEATSDGQAVKGEDGGTSQVGIGVAVSVNVVQETNTAYLGSGTHAGAGVNVRALQATGAATDTFLTSATSGAGGSKVGIAGSVALNIVTLDTTARISGGASVAAGAGASTIEAGNAVSATATAEPSDEGVTGGKVGVGASFAMNLLTTTTTAELQDGATMTGGAGLSVSATSGLDTTTEASAGAAGGIAVDASVALALLNQTTIARIGTGNALTMGAGALSVIATNTGTNTATSTGENKSDKVGVGASASVILGNGASGGALNNTSLTSAVLARSATAGAVTIEASADRTYDAHATATAGGGNFSSTDEKKNDKTGGTSTTADSLDKTKDSQRDQDGKKPASNKTITVAAAAGIAAAQDVVSATLENVTLNASGAVSVTATNSVGMAASGIGAAKDPKSKVGIGVGVGLAILNNTTSATIADNATITNASGLTIAATSRENADGPYRSKLSALGIAGASGKQVAVAGSLAVAISTGKTEAKIGSGVTVTDGGAMAVTVDNESHLSAKALAGSVSTSGIAVGGSIAVVVSEKEYEASVGADSDLTGSALSVTAINRKIDAGPDFNFDDLDDLDAFADSLADLATGKLLGDSNYYVEAIGGAGGSGVAVQGSFGVMVFSDTLTASVGSNADVDVGTGAVTLSAGGDFVAKSLSGALSASTSSAAVGVSSTVVVSDGTTTSSLGENSQITSAGSFSNTASAKQDIRSYAASASAASSAGVSGVAGVVTSENRVEALMARGAEVTISGAGAVSLGATNDFKIFGLAAGVGVGSTAGIGAAATVVVVNNITRAALADGTSAADRAEINADGDISITATATEEGDLFSVAGAAGGTAGVGAGAGIYVFDTTTEALVGDFAKVGNAFDSGSLTVGASDTSTLFAASGAAGVGGTAGVGAGVAVGVLTKTTTAEIGASARVDSGNVVVDAQSWETLTNMTAGVGVGGKAGLAGAVTVLSVTPTTTARIGELARVHADGNVAVLADGKTEIDMLDGAFAAGTAGVGASVGVTVIDATTLATVDANAEVTALGNGAAQSYTTGYAPGFASYASDEGFTSADFQSDATSELTDADAASARTTGLDLLAKKRTSTPLTATAQGVIVNASDKTSVRALSVAGSAGAVGVSISAGVPVITTNTKAQVAAGAKLNQLAGTPATTQDVTVAAASDIYTLGFSGAVAAGGVGVGAGVSVMVIDTTTEALVGAGTISANGDVAVTARSTQDIVGVGVAGAAAGSVAVSGGISVFDVTTKTKAQLAGTVTAQNNVDVIADDKTRTSVLAGALAVGGTAGVGGAISVVNLNKEIDASIASGATVSALGRRGNHTIFTGDSFGATRAASRGVNVQSNSLQSGFTLAAAGAASGSVGVSGVITLYLMDVKNTASIGNNASINTSGGNATGNAAQDVAVTARDETVTSVAAGGVAAGALGGVAGVVDVGVFKNTAAASIGNNVTLNAKRDVLVSGLSNKAGEAYVMGAGGGIVGLAAGIAIYNYGDGVAPAGEADKNIGEASDDGTLSFASITNDAQAQARDGTANDQLAASDDDRIRDVSQSAQNRRNQIDVAGAAAPVDPSDPLYIPPGTSASIGSGTINAGGTVGVKSSDGLNVKMTTGAVAVGAVGGGAGIGVLTVDTGSTAKIDGNGTMEAGAVNVEALTDHTLYGLHFAGSGGLVAAISADVGIHTDNSRTTAAIRGKEITTGGAVAVNADSTRDLTVDAIGVSVAGTLAVGASVGEATVGGAVSASISDDATIGSNTGRAASVSVTASATSTADTEAVAVGGGIGAALQGAGSIATVKPSVTASVDSAQIFTSGLTNVKASATGSADTEATGVAVAGGLAVGASIAHSKVDSGVLTTVSNGTVIDAGSITIGTSSDTGGVNSGALGAAGALVGLAGSDAKSLNTSSAQTMVSGSGLTATGGQIDITANSETLQTADAAGFAFGILAAGTHDANANSDTVTRTAVSDMTGITAGGLNVTATGADNNTATAVSGSGGVVAGAAAAANTDTTSVTEAYLTTSDPSKKYLISVINGQATVEARHTAQFSGSVDSTQASVVGASGSSLNHEVDSTVNAYLGNDAWVRAANLTINAANYVHNFFLGQPVYSLDGAAPAPFDAGAAGWNVNSGSGGLLNLPAGKAYVNIVQNTEANVGDDADIRLLLPTSGLSKLQIEAYNEVITHQKAKLDSAGAIATASSVVELGATQNASVNIGSDGTLRLDVGDIFVGAWNQAAMDGRSAATTYGVAGAPDGHSWANLGVANTVNIGTDVRMEATDGISPSDGTLPSSATVNIFAGRSPTGEQGVIDLRTTIDLFNNSAIPIPGSPDAQANVDSNATITQGTTDNSNPPPLKGILAAGDITIGADRGDIKLSAVGTGKDIYREALAAAASAVSETFGGDEVTFDYHGGSTSNTGMGRLELNGLVATGLQKFKSLTLDYGLACDPNNVACIEISGTVGEDGITRGTISADNSVIVQRLAQLELLKENTEGDTVALGAYQNEINFLQQKLVALGLGEFDSNGNFELKPFVSGKSEKQLLIEQKDATEVQLDGVTIGFTNQATVVSDGLPSSISATYDDGTVNDYTSYVASTRTLTQSMSAYTTALATPATIVNGDGDTVTNPDYAAAQTLINTYNTYNTNVTNGLTTANGYQSTIDNKLAANQTLQSEINDLIGVINDPASTQTQVTTAQGDITSKLSQIVTNNTAIKTASDNLNSQMGSINTNLTNLATTANGGAVTSGTAKDNLDRLANAKTFVSDYTTALGTENSTISDRVTTLQGTTPPPGGYTVGTFTTTASDLASTIASLDSQIPTASDTPATAPSTPMITVHDLAARLGNISLSGNLVTGGSTGVLSAPANAEINITNNTAATLKVNNITMPSYDAGNVRVNGVLVDSVADVAAFAPGQPTSTNFAQVITGLTSSRPIVSLTNNYNPTSIAYTAAQQGLAPPDLIVNGVINNVEGTVDLTSEYGNIFVYGAINAGSVNILARNGDFVSSYVNGFNHIGGDPASFNNSTSPAEAGIGIIANGAISISARYLNINSTIQSGIVDLSLNLDGNPTLTALNPAQIGVSQAAIDSAATAYRDSITAGGTPSATTTVTNGHGQTITLNLNPIGLDTAALKSAIDEYQAAIVLDSSANPMYVIPVSGGGSPQLINIKDFLSGTGVTPRLEFNVATAATYKTNSGANGLAYQVVGSLTDNIGASYDVDNAQYVVNGAEVNGGYIQLYGQILNTSSSGGELNVLDGFGRINITNAGSIPLVLQTLDAGNDSTGVLGRGTAGVIDITDITKVVTPTATSGTPSPSQVSVKRTVYTRDYVPGSATGQIKMAVQTGTLDTTTGLPSYDGQPLSPVAVFGADRSTTYATTANQRYIWTTATEYRLQVSVSTEDRQLFGSSALSIDFNTSFKSIGSANVLSETRLADGTYLSQADGTTPTGTTQFINGSDGKPAILVTSPTNYDPVANSSISNDALVTGDFSFSDPRSSYTQTGSSSRSCNWWTLCIDSTVTTNYLLDQYYTTIKTHSLKADHPIAINFIGQNSASVEVTSSTDVTLNGPVNARNGDVEIAANGTGSSIISGSPGAQITGKRISLTAGGSVGTSAAAVQLRMDGAAAGNGALIATAAAGNVNLNAGNGIVVQRVTAAGDPTTDKGNVIITSGTDIIAGQVAQFFTPTSDTEAVIQAPRVILTAGNGDVGSIADPLTVNTGYSLASRSFGDSVDPDPYYGLSVLAAGDIGIASTTWGDNTQTWTGNADGTMLVDQVVSLGGDVFLRSPGQILDNNPTQTVDTRTYNELLGYWNTLGLVRGSSENAAKVQLAIDAFANGRTADYRAYWQIRMTQPDGGADFDPSYEFTLATDSLQYKALVDQGVDIAAFEAAQTDRYRELDGVVGGLTTSYVDGYSYDPNDHPDDVAALTRGSDWSERQLAFSMSPGALKTVTGTNPVLKAPNVSGRTVTLDAGIGIGETIGAGSPTLGVLIPADLEPENLTDAQKIALVTAERSDLQIIVDAIGPLPADPTQAQIDAYNDAVSAGILGSQTIVPLGLDESEMTAAERAALHAAANRLVAASDLTIQVLNKRPLNFNASTALNVDVTGTPGTLDNGTAYLASRGNGLLDSISVPGETRIKVVGPIANVGTGIVSTGNLILESSQGGIGTGINPFNTSQSFDPMRLDLLTDATITARAQGDIDLDVTGTAIIDTVYSPRDVRIVADDNITNANDDLLINVLGAEVVLDAVAGSIGTNARSLNVGVGLGGQITADAAQEINLFGPANSLFIIGSAKAGSIIRLTAAGEGVIDGLVEAPGDITIATGGRTLFTALGDVHSTAGLVDINSASLKMLNGAKILANAGQVTIATTGDALVTGITSEIGLADAVSVTAGGRIFAGTSDPRTDITAMSVGAGVYLSAGLGIGDKTQANTSALDNTVTDVANPLRIRTHTLEAEATDGGIALHALTAMELTSLTAPNGTIDVTGDDVLTVTSAQSGGSQSFTAEGNLTFVSLETTGIPAVPGPEDAGDVTLVSVTGDVEGDQINANGSADLTGNEVDFNSITTGADTKILARTGAVTGVDVDAGGSSEITGTGITITTLKAGVDSTLTGGTGPVNILTSLNAGGNSTITGNGVKFDTIKAGLNSEIYSTGDIIGDLEEAGETIINIAGFGPGNSGILDVKVMRAKNIHLQATGTLDVGTLEVAQNLSLRADIIRALDITQVPSGPDPLNVTLTGPDGTVATFAQVNIDSPAGVVMPQVFVSETLMTTTAQFVDVVNAIVPIQGTSPMAGTFLLTTPSQTVFVDDRTQTPKTNPPSNIQMYLNGNPFTMTLDGIATSTDSFVVVYDDTVELTDVLGLPYDGISLVRDTVRQMWNADDPIVLPGSFGSFGLGNGEEDDDDFDLSQFDGTLVEIDGIEYSVVVRGNGPAVLLRQ